jgi:hypothetical protein
MAVLSAASDDERHQELEISVDTPLSGPPSSAGVVDVVAAKKRRRRDRMFEESVDMKNQLDELERVS